VYQVHGAALAILIGKKILLIKEDRRVSGSDYVRCYGYPGGKVDPDQDNTPQVAFEEFGQEIGICDKQGNLTPYSERLLPYKVLLHMWRSLREAAPEAMVVAGMPLMVYRVPEEYSDYFLRLPKVYFEMFEGHIPGEADDWTRSAHEVSITQLVKRGFDDRFYLEDEHLMSPTLRSSLYEMFWNVLIPQRPVVNPAVALVTDEEAARVADADAARDADADAAAKAAETSEAAVAAEDATASLAWCGEGTCFFSEFLQQTRDRTRGSGSGHGTGGARGHGSGYGKGWARDRVLGHGPERSWRRPET
jgi:hypothetical protein